MKTVKFLAGLFLIILFVFFILGPSIGIGLWWSKNEIEGGYFIPTIPMISFVFGMLFLRVSDWWRETTKKDRENKN